MVLAGQSCRREVSNVGSLAGLSRRMGTALCGVCVLCFGLGPAPTCVSCPRVPTDMHSLVLDGAGAVDKLPWRVHAASSGCENFLVFLCEVAKSQ